MTAILGLSAYYHDSAACLLVDGKIVAAAQEERFTRKKHDAGFPRNAARWCLEAAGLPLSRLDHVAFYDKPLVKFERLFETYLEYAPRGFASFRKAMPLWISDRLWMSESIGKDLGWDGKVLFGDHHESHAASAFYPSPYEDAAVLTMDGVGEWATSSIGVGRGNVAHDALRAPIPALDRPPLLGVHVLLRVQGATAANTSSWASRPYGEPKYADLIREKVVHVCDDGSIRLDMEYFDFATGLTMTGRRVRAPVRRTRAGARVEAHAARDGPRAVDPGRDRGDRAEDGAPRAEGRRARSTSASRAASR